MSATTHPLPLADSLFREIAKCYGTPVYVYHEAGIQARASQLQAAFGWASDYRNYFAVKATPTPAILRILAESGMGFDCSSATELKLVEQTKLVDQGIFYSSNNTPNQDYRQADKLGAIINLDKAAYLEQVLKALPKVPTKMAIRYNPGKISSANQIIGLPKESKFGDSKAHVLACLKQMDLAGVQQIGLHTMLVSNQTDPLGFSQSAQALKDLKTEAQQKLGIDISFLNLGGGLGINYRPGERPVSVEVIARAIRDVLGETKIPICSEFGRYLTGPNGYLLTKVTRGVVESYQPFLTVDVSVNNLNRLATVEAAYHQLSVIGKAKAMSVVGSMCTNNDKMFENRQLPTNIASGDLVVVRDVGAHGRANATNYNGQTRCGEVLVKADGSHCLIRRHEGVAEILTTTKGL